MNNAGHQHKVIESSSRREAIGSWRTRAVIAAAVAALSLSAVGVASAQEVAGAATIPSASSSTAGQPGQVVGGSGQAVLPRTGEGPAEDQAPLLAAYLAASIVGLAASFRMALW